MGASPQQPRLSTRGCQLGTGRCRRRRLEAWPPWKLAGQQRQQRYEAAPAAVAPRCVGGTCRPGVKAPPAPPCPAGALGGRLDHTLSNLSTLYMHRDMNLVLLGDGNLARLVPAGRALIRPHRRVEGPLCGLVPCAGGAVASSRWAGRGGVGVGECEVGSGQVRVGVWAAQWGGSLPVVCWPAVLHARWTAGGKNGSGRSCLGRHDAG